MGCPMAPNRRTSCTPQATIAPRPTPGPGSVVRTNRRPHWRIATMRPTCANRSRSFRRSVHRPGRAGYPATPGARGATDPARATPKHEGHPAGLSRASSRSWRSSAPAPETPNRRPTGALPEDRRPPRLGVLRKLGVRDRDAARREAEASIPKMGDRLRQDRGSGSTLRPHRRPINPSRRSGSMWKRVSMIAFLGCSPPPPRARSLLAARRRSTGAFRDRPGRGHAGGFSGRLVDARRLFEPDPDRAARRIGNRDPGLPAE